MSVILKAYRCYVEGFDEPAIHHATRAGKARYKCLLEINESYDGVEFYQIKVLRAPSLDIEFPDADIVPDLTERERDIILHSFGGGSHIRSDQWGYRNHYCTSPDHETLNKLVNIGLFTGPYGDGLNAFFYLTDSGKEVARALIGLREVRS